MSHELIVIGGGAAGMMAAACAAHAGASVLLLERNPKLGRKLYITGKGRCNLTNHCTVEEVLAHTVRNRRFLFSALTHTPPAWVEAFFDELGVPLKVERGGRVFPNSDRAADVIDALLLLLRRRGVSIRQDRATALLTRGESLCGVQGERQKYECKGVILATGGCSYPATGSTGDGYGMAVSAGHGLVPVRPSLVPLEEAGEICAALQGLSLKNVALSAMDHKGAVVFREQGELLFSHFGLSGPLALSASARMDGWAEGGYSCSIDLKPALDEKTLDARLVREFSGQGSRNLGNALSTLLPRLMIPAVGNAAGLPLDVKCHDLTRQERRRLLETLKDFRIPLKGLRPLEEAVVTAGGVRVDEVDPKTMASKRLGGLFFAGEILDVDAYTGGFNLQIAWATGRAAGEGAADYCRAVAGRRSTKTEQTGASDLHER